MCYYEALSNTCFANTFKQISMDSVNSSIEVRYINFVFSIV